MSKWLKTVIFGIWGGLLIPLVAKNLEIWLRDNVFSDRSALASAIFNDIIAISRLAWFNFALTLMSGVVIGVALEFLARRSGDRRASAVRSLGHKFGSLSDSIKSRTPSAWPDSAHDLKPAIRSALISAKKFDVWVPSERVYELPDGSFLCEYFSCVGRLLENGHLDEASREALSWKPFLDRGQLP